MRSFIFNLGFWSISFLYVLLAAVLALAPGSNGVRWAVRRYSRRMVQLMKLCGIKPETRGKERLPPPPFIIAPKHSSYGDGFIMYTQFDDIAFVTGDHLERFPLVPKVLEKLGAIVIDNCGGPEARRDLAASFAKAAEDKRNVLIYPEGNLSKVGKHHRFRAGVWHMQEASRWPVVPVATSLGLRWQQEDFKKYPGPAVIEFLDPILPGLGKDEFLRRLSGAIIENTDRLVAEGRQWDAAHNLQREPDRPSKKAEQDTAEDHLAHDTAAGEGAGKPAK